jgi:hypothetical protein
MMSKAVFPFFWDGTWKFPVPTLSNVSGKC